jgi:hypothetical protein
MYMKLPIATRTKIHRLCKYFLWGYSKEGKRKTRLVAWSRRAKKHGGLAIKDINAQNTALLARWITYIFDKPDHEWTMLFKVILNHINWQNKKANRKLGYTLLDKILFD